MSLGHTLCKAWGGSTALNPLLDALAHDPAQHVEFYPPAIRSITATRDLGAVRALYDLFDDDDDQVRGAVLEAYHLDSPSPRDFIAKLHGGSRNRSLYGRLQIEAEAFGHGLDTPQLAEAFAAVTVHFDTLQDLRPFSLRGLLHRAVERRFHEIPPALVVQCWIAQGSHADISYDPEDVLTKLLQEYAAFFAHVWYYILHTLDEGTHHFIYLVDPLAKSCTDRIFDILPLTSEGLTH